MLGFGCGLTLLKGFLGMVLPRMVVLFVNKNILIIYIIFTRLFSHLIILYNIVFASHTTNLMALGDDVCSITIFDTTHLTDSTKHLDLVMLYLI